MRILFAVFILLLAPRALGASSWTKSDERAVLVALMQVETGGRAEQVGAAGERSAWQFMPSTWRKYTSAAFTQASTDPVLARMVAQVHLRTIVEQLRRQGKPVTAKAIARAWNPHAPPSYAELVANLVEVLK